MLLHAQSTNLLNSSRKASGGTQQEAGGSLAKY